MADSVSNDRAIEVLASVLHYPDEQARDFVREQLAALAGAGLQITDLKREEVAVLLSCADWIDDDDGASPTDDFLRSAVAKLRRISGGV